jgi:hypothetical protein
MQIHSMIRIQPTRGLALAPPARMPGGRAPADRLPLNQRGFVLLIYFQ